MRLPRWLQGRARTSPPDDGADRPPGRAVAAPGHRTDRGEVVRSLAEATIANLLHRARLDYAYRRAVTGGAAWGVQAPAFSVPGPNGAVLWEHLARDDHPGDWAARRAWYQDNGFVEGQRLFVTRDGDGGEAERRALRRVAEVSATAYRWTAWET